MSSTKPRRSRSTGFVAPDPTSYHSFHDDELYEPVSSSPTAGTSGSKEDQFGPKPISRHDSGYESSYPESKFTISNERSSKSPSSSRHNDNSSSRTAQHRRRMTRSSRPNSPGHHYHHHHHHQHIHIHNAHAAIHTPAPRHYQQPNSYIYFPAPESMSSGADHEEAEAEAAYHPPPPQTVHYWMSDSTRRMEYAAIDAASRGVKGWIIKHVVPNCLVPKSCRRLTFDDDTGSVRRYRLELDCDGEEGKSGKKLGWLLGRS